MGDGIGFKVGDGIGRAVDTEGLRDGAPLKGKVADTEGAGVTTGSAVG